MGIWDKTCNRSKDSKGFDLKMGCAFCNLVLVTSYERVLSNQLVIAETRAFRYLIDWA